MILRYSKEAVLILILLLVVIGSAVDLLTDLAHGATYQHIGKEALLVAISVLAILWLLYGLRRQAAEIEALQQELEAAGKAGQQPDEYVLAARRQLGEVVARQFTSWGLTGSEREVGWLLLKGLSLKEIAVIRNTLEKTVRQQASAIYKKADVAGRHAFSAWFIEDFL